MTQKEIERDMKNFTDGASFIRIGQLAKYLGQKNVNRVKEKYTKDAFKLDGSPSYFIPDIAKNIFRAGLVIALTLSAFTQKAEAKEDFDLTGQGFEVMSATAYCVGEVTANGSRVHEGGCACSLDRIGQVAIIYTLDGEFIGYFECNDTGAAGGGVRKGTVIDIYRTDYDRCVEFMELTGGKVYVKWIDGKG